jgi:hypothetical protein
MAATRKRPAARAAGADAPTTPAASSPSVLQRAKSLLGTPYAWIFGAYFALRIVSVAGVDVMRFPDSQSWLALDFSGAGVRLWTVPLLFKILPADSLRLAGQTGLSIVCWTALAGMVALTVRHRTLKPTGFALVLALGLVGAVTNWDTVILGESFAVSITVGAIAAWWAFVLWPNRWTTATVCAAIVLWAFLRHTDVTLSVLIAIIVAATLLAPTGRKLRGIVLLVLIVTLAWGLPALNKNEFNRVGVLDTILSERILVSKDYTDWFADHGMPDGPSVRKLAGAFYTRGLGMTPFNKNKRLTRWLRDDGTKTYFEFLITHPRYTFTTPITFALDSDKAVLSSMPYGTYRQVLPDPVEEVLYGGPGSFIFLTVGALALALLAFGRRGWTKREIIPGAAVAFSFLLYFVTYHGVASEYQRHYLVAAVAMRLSLLILGLLAIDRLLDRGQPTSSRTTT